MATTPAPAPLSRWCSAATWRSLPSPTNPACYTTTFFRANPSPTTGRVFPFISFALKLIPLHWTLALRMSLTKGWLLAISMGWRLVASLLSSGSNKKGKKIEASTLRHLKTYIYIYTILGAKSQVFFGLLLAFGDRSEGAGLSPPLPYTCELAQQGFPW